ncbi:MAG: metallophosphoesterase family protein, partial [Halanaerobiaceae bacterium]
MSENNIRLLCTGDLHLGRHPSRIPAEYDSRQYSPVFLWERIVQRAIEQEIDALLITGDIIDRENRYFEAFGPFEAGVKKLAAKNIAVVVIAGNHDYDVLPGLIRNIDLDNLIFLGAEGKWEYKTLERNGKVILGIMGWSYPDRQVRKDPLEDIVLPPDDIPLI